MGTDGKKVDLYLNDPNTGEWVQIPDTIAEVTFADDDPDHERPFLRSLERCYYCGHSDSKRQKEDCIRCRRWSRWVKPDGEVCEAYTGHTLTFPLDGTRVKMVEREAEE